MTEQISQEAIEKAKVRFQEEKTGQKQKPSSNNHGRFDVSAYLDHYGRTYTIETKGTKTHYHLDPCPFNPDHKGKDAAIIQDEKGKLGAKCFHNSCADKGWAEFRRAISGNDNLERFIESDQPLPEKLRARFAKNALAEAEKAEEVTGAKPILVNLSDVETEEVSWLWNPYIPLGKLTILEGDPGIGKTWLALQLAANVSTGNAFPGNDGNLAGKRESGNVLYLTAEDGLGDTLKPRLDKAGANVGRITALTGFRGTDENNKERTYAVTSEAIAVIEKAIQETMPALMVVDPLQAYLGAHVDMHRANEVRPILTRLSELAEKYRVAVLCIRHLSKSAQDRAIYRGLGSIDFSAAARSILLVGEDPQNKERKILTHCKSSLAPWGVSQVFELKEGQFLWTGTSDLTSESLFMPMPSDSQDEKTAIEEAEEFLKAVLADGAKEVTEILKEAKKQGGHSEKTIRRARKNLNVQAIRKGEAGKKGGGTWSWFLPDQEGQKEDPNQDGQDEDLKKTVIGHFDGHLDHLNKSLEPQGLEGNHLDGHVATLINLNKPASLLASDYDGQDGQENALREKFQNDHDGHLKNDQIIELSTFEKKERG